MKEKDKNLKYTEEERQNLQIQILDKEEEVQDLYEQIDDLNHFLRTFSQPKFSNQDIDQKNHSGNQSKRNSLLDIIDGNQINFKSTFRNKYETMVSLNKVQEGEINALVQKN